MVGPISKIVFKLFKTLKSFCNKNKLVLTFFISHVILAIFLGRLFAFAPDEKWYLFTFNNVYTLPINTIAQMGSGWITAPTSFLWVAYLPAKILNVVGVPDYLSIRLLSIGITTISLFLFLKMNQTVTKVKTISNNLIFFSFFIPSVFLWTTTGLREAFIIFEITLFLVGLNYLFLKKTKVGIIFLFIGSYGLLSTKPYLWVLLMIAVIVFMILNLIRKTHKEYFVKLIAVGFIAPLILFAGTTSQYALSFIFNTSVTEVGFRSGDSVTQIDDIKFHGDSTLIIKLKVCGTKNFKQG